MTIVIKIALALLLAGCLLDMPYGYFQFIRLAGCIGFCYLAYVENEKKSMHTVVLFVAFAILLNPIWKIHFSRYVWNVIDVIIATILIAFATFELIVYLRRSKNLNKT